MNDNRIQIEVSAAKKDTIGKGKDLSAAPTESLQALAAEAPKEEQAAPEGRKPVELVDNPSDRPDMGKKKLTIFKNNDNESLLPFGNERCVFGCVEEVNGPGAKEIAGYTLTRHELLQLVKYWYREALDDEWYFFIFGQTGSSEFRRGNFARRRIRRAATAIGQEAVDQAIKEVREEFKAKVNDARLWDIFENGTEEQREAVLAETWRDWCEKDAAEAFERLEELEREFPGDFIAMVLRNWPDDKRRPVLISPTDSELNAVLQASGKFEIEADVSRLRTLMVDQKFTSTGFLRATRRNGELLFEFPDSSPGTIGWLFLKSVTDQIKKLLHADTGERIPACLISLEGAFPKLAIPETDHPPASSIPASSVSDPEK